MYYQSLEALRPTNIRLELYMSWIQKYYGKISLSMTHNKTSKLQYFVFFIEETNKMFILGHLTSDRLGLTKVLYHNKEKRRVKVSQRPILMHQHP